MQQGEAWACKGRTILPLARWDQVLPVNNGEWLYLGWHASIGSEASKVATRKITLLAVHCCGTLTLQAVAAGGAAPATIDLCSSDDDEPSPHAPPPKRRPPAAAAPAAASYPMGPTRQLHPPQRRPDTRHKATGAQPGASARRQQPGPPRLGIPDSPRGGGQGARGGAGASWMFGGEGAYVPDPRAAKVDMRLRLHEVVDVLDIGLVAHHARAVLDSGAPLERVC